MINAIHITHVILGLSKLCLLVIDSIGVNPREVGGRDP